MLQKYSLPCFGTLRRCSRSAHRKSRTCLSDIRRHRAKHASEHSAEVHEAQKPGVWPSDSRVRARSTRHTDFSNAPGSIPIANPETSSRTGDQGGTSKAETGEAEAVFVRATAPSWETLANRRGPERTPARALARRNIQSVRFRPAERRGSLRPKCSR